MTSNISETSAGEGDDYHVPIEYKIVDLPIIHFPQMETLKTFPCKIYRKIELNADQNPAELPH